jgi:RNA polymerase sigma-70 factor (ECF subfamily)
VLAEPLRPEPLDFDTFYRSELDYVWISLTRLGIRRNDRSDLTQDVFLKAFRLWPECDRSRPLRPWLFAIAFRVAMDFKRLKRHGDESLSHGPDVLDQSADAESQLAASQDRALVLKALAPMEMNRKAVFVMHEIDGYSIPEIAQTLGVPLNTLYSRLRLAWVDFRAAVQRLEPREAKDD